MDGLFLNLLVSIVLTAIVYMTFPLIRIAINHGRFEKKQAKRIALWNSIVVGVFFCITTIAFSDGSTTWNAAPALLYYWINCAVLTDKYAVESSQSVVDQSAAPAQESESTAHLPKVSHSPSSDDKFPKSYNTTNSDLQIATPVISQESLSQSSSNSAQSLQAKPILFCRKCGNRLVEGYVFCNKCGTKIPTDGTAN